MRLSDVTENSKGIDDKILELIDLKIEDDMKQVITEIRMLEKAIEANEKKHNLVLWVVGIAFVLIAIFIALIALK